VTRYGYAQLSAADRADVDREERRSVDLVLAVVVVVVLWVVGQALAGEAALETPEPTPVYVHPQPEGATP
jgi:hypothetical protein